MLRNTRFIKRAFTSLNLKESSITKSADTQSNNNEPDSRDMLDPQDFKHDTNWFQNQIFNSELKQPKWLTNNANSIEKRKGPLLEEIISELKLLRADDITVIDARAKCNHLSHVIVCQGQTERQVYTMAEGIRKLSRDLESEKVEFKPDFGITGYESDEWMVLDIGDIMVHFFTPLKRLEMNIEGLWAADNNKVENDEQYETQS